MDAGVDAVTRRAEARIGTVLRSKWRIDRLLGVGGMAAVYAGTHRNGKRGAIKMLHLELSTDPEARARFLREGYVANTVGHPGAVSVLDDDVAEDGAVFVVMELLEGQTAEALAASRPERRLGPKEVMRIAVDWLDILAAAHDKGIVHRDLKPENLFITQEGVVKVLDFGIARMQDLPSVAKMTKTGNAMGTPAYMPPEQALGEWNRVDARSDLWAVGASLFSMLSGRLVHEAPTLNQFLLKAMTQPAPPIRAVMPGLPAEIAEVVDRALAFDPKDRWQDARSMQAAAQRAIAWLDKHGEPRNLVVVAVPAGDLAATDGFAATVAASAPSFPGASGSRRWVLLVVAAVVATFAVGGAALAFLLVGRSREGADARVAASATPSTSAVVAAAPIASPAAPIVSLVPSASAPEVQASSSPAPTEEPTQAPAAVTAPAVKKGPSAKPGADFSEWGK